MSDVQRRSMTEAHIRGEDQHLVLDGRALLNALQRDEVEAIFKYGAVTRDDPGGVVKEVHHIEGQFLAKGRPTSSCVITSSSIDRDDDIVFSDGMIVTDGYKKNPAVMPMHMYREIPIGFTERLAQYVRHVAAIWQWLTDIAESQAGRYYSLWQNHVFNCASIGFVPKDWERREDSTWGIDFKEWELLEHSIVSIPANPDATRTDGMKQYLQLAGEMIFNGPSPLMKSAFEKAEHRKVYASGMKSEMKPYANEHSCPLNSTQYERYARKNCAEKHDGKCIDVIYGIKDNKSEIHSLHYPKDTWTESAAKSHCASRGGTFEAATSNSAEAANESILDAPESILGAFEVGVLSKTETVERLQSWSDKRAAWAEGKLAEISVRTIKNKLEVQHG